MRQHAADAADADASTGEGDDTPVGGSGGGAAECQWNGER